jgi:hypothetical protein
VCVFSDNCFCCCACLDDDDDDDDDDDENAFSSGVKFHAQFQHAGSMSTLTVTPIDLTAWLDGSPYVQDVFQKCATDRFDMAVSSFWGRLECKMQNYRPTFVAIDDDLKDPSSACETQHRQVSTHTDVQSKTV